ncbi:NAD(P)H-dependent amine dehydrogenase family protein [Fodinibius sp. SL11]|uniref:NAD(P)H-dependent amine dehydrogenase family protein n=1 Tax=Fodinibius sp. SL11 TaxID=3425690 RepID=UPI003F88514C
MIKVVHIGIGPLGQKVVKYARERKGIEIVGAVDLDPQKIGQDLGEFCGLDSLNVPIMESLDDVLNEKNPDVAVVTTLSSLERIESQLKELGAAGLDIVSTCEELSYPWETQPEVAGRINETCKENNVTCLGTGVNPGFLMDYLPSVLSSVCQNVEKVRVSRVQDASSRRIPFQKKIGAGLTDGQFKEKEQNGSLRHVGLPESVYMIAKAMNWELDNVEETLQPVYAKEHIGSGYTDIGKNNPSGVEQIGRGFIDGEEKVTLHFRAAVGEEKSFDKVEIEGTPSFSSTINGGVNGDIATSAITVNAIASVTKAHSGLKTMLDVPVPSCFSEV